MTTALFEPIARDRNSTSARDDTALDKQQARLRRLLRRSGQVALLLAVGTSTGLCLLAYLAIAPGLSMAGAEVTLRYILAAIAAVPTVALWIVFRSLLWNRSVRHNQHSLLQQAFVSRCLGQARAGAVVFSPRERALLDAAGSAEQSGSGITGKRYARALRLVLPVAGSHR